MVSVELSAAGYSPDAMTLLLRAAGNVTYAAGAATTITGGGAAAVAE